MNPAYMSAIAALCGSAIGAPASVGTNWLTLHYRSEVLRRAQEYTRREGIFVEFIDSSSRAFADALLRTSIEDPSKIILLYATMGKFVRSNGGSRAEGDGPNHQNIL